MRYTDFLTEEQLLEIKMSPGNLTKLVKEIPGALVGLEFEMIVPDAQIEDDSNSGENDYDQDERCDDIDDVVSFFQRGNGGDYNDANRLRDRMQEAYFEWVGDQSGNAWGNVAGDEVRGWLEANTSIKEDAMSEYREENPDADEDEVETAGETAFEAAYDEAMDESWGNEYYDSAHEQWREDYESDLSERDWLRAEGYRYMSDIENAFDETYWPYQHSAESATDIQGIAEEFSDAVGREVKASAGYHNIDRSSQAADGFYILETDGSLRPNDDSDEAGLEFVSPPLPLADMMTEIGKVAAWAKQRGAYTGKSNKTGLHMNVSVPGLSRENLDFVKLAILLGDNHVLKEFDRYVVSGTNYAQSSFDLLAKSVQNNPAKAKEMMDKMRNHFDLAASKAIHSGNTDKYTSINVKGNRVEFRGPGNNYLGMFAENPTKLTAPLMRMVVALDAAVDPEKYREEYQKKLYKLLSNSVPNKDLLGVFTDYASGKGFNQDALRNLLKQRKSQRALEKGNVPGGISWGVYRLSTNARMKRNGQYILFKDTGKADAMEQLRGMIEGHNVNINEFELRPLTKYELYRVATGRTVEYANKPIEFLASTPDEATSKISRYVVDFAIPGATNTPGAADEFAVRSVLTPSGHTTTPTTTATGPAQLPQRAWQIVNTTDGMPVSEFLAPDRAHAVQKFQDFIMRAQAAGRNTANYELKLRDSDAAISNSPAQSSDVRNDMYRNATANRSTEQPADQSDWEREQESYRSGMNWQVYNHDDVNTVVRTLNNVDATHVAAALPNIENELNLPRGSLRVRVI
jgi:hypothetical protein